jgi:hypothetical protein
VRRRDLGGTAAPEGSGEGDAVAAGVERFQRQRTLGQREGRRGVVGDQAQFGQRQQLADMADADLVDLDRDVRAAQVVQVRQRIAAPQRDRVGKQGGRAVDVTVGPRLDGTLVQGVQGPQVHGEEPGLQEPDRVALGAQVVARVTAGSIGFQEPAKVGQRHPHVPGRFRRVQSRPEQLDGLIAGQDGPHGQCAEQLADAGTPKLRRVDRHTVARQPHRPDDSDLGPVRGRRG